MAKKTKVVEITMKVRVPAWMTVAQAKREATGSFYGPVYYDVYDQNERPRSGTLYPRWGKARIAP